MLKETISERDKGGKLIDSLPFQSHEIWKSFHSVSPMLSVLKESFLDYSKILGEMRLNAETTYSKTSRKWFWKREPGGPGRYRRGSDNGIKNMPSSHLGTPRNRSMMSAMIHVFIVKFTDGSGMSCRMRPTRKRGLSIMVGKSEREPCCRARLNIRRIQGELWLVICDFLGDLELNADFKP